MERLREIQCRGCGDPIEQSARPGRPRQWCSNECRCRAQLRAWPSRDRIAGVERECLVCGDPFSIPSGLRAGAYKRQVCSPRCSNRRHALLDRYRLTPAAFRELLDGQGGRCPICSTDDPGARGWCVDHDHACCPGGRTCGECVRGVLCWSCNVRLGAYADEPGVLRSAADYLDRPTA